MTLLTIKPTKADIAIANAISHHTSPIPEELASVLTVAADERVLLALAAAGWLYGQRTSAAVRKKYDHALIVAVVATLLPHLLKLVFDQTRPDRLTVRGHLHGIPVSGKPEDAFPSGHALHMGALASAASQLPSPQRETAWTAAVGLSLTRIVLLAHWTSDVVAGFALGALLERFLRRFTGYQDRAARQGHDPRPNAVRPVKPRKQRRS